MERDNDSVTYRKATKDDAYGIEYVAAHSWKESYWDYMPHDYLENRVLTIENKIERAIKLLESTNTYYVAEINNKIVGILHFKENQNDKYKDYGYLESIYVLKEYQGMGIGKKLFKIAIDGLQELGYNKMYLECLQGNKTIDFYKKYKGKIVEIIDFPIKDFVVKADIVIFDDIASIL